ncbi:MAG: pyroglutamyl-peptidase I [Rhodopseudomonas sp.]|nr:pyroglutamyl-peptidase I [Rhodopseudomonas sp.]
MLTILITGFGPFPGAPFNPTGALVRHLARLRRPALADIRIVPHVFTTSYAAVDRDLPRLLADQRPDAVLMFGLHGRATAIRIETRARNALALLPDASGKVLRRGVIAPQAPAALTMHMPAQRLLRAAAQAGVPARLSRDAGRYLCNYLCWRATEDVALPGGPKLAAFIHVPPVRRFARPLAKRPAHSRKKTFTAADLARAGEAILVALAAAVNRP